jgi:hypothetical protein
MAGIFASRKEQICTDLISTFDALMCASNHRKEIAKAWRELGRTMDFKIFAMAMTQIPGFQKQLEAIRDSIMELGEVQEELAAKQERTGEDIRDVIERYYVVFRINEECLKARHAYEDATAGLEEAQRKYAGASGANQARYEAYLIAAKSKKAAALNEVREKMRLLVQGKDAYNRFKLRRFNNGWQLYGEGLRTASEKEIVIFRRIRGYLDQISSLGGDNGQVMEELAGAMMRIDAEEASVAQEIPLPELVGSAEPSPEPTPPTELENDSVDWN